MLEIADISPVEQQLGERPVFCQGQRARDIVLVVIRPSLFPQGADAKQYTNVDVQVMVYQRVLAACGSRQGVAVAADLPTRRV